MKSIEIQNLDQHLKPLKIGDKTTPIELSDTEFRVNEKATMEKAVEVKGDLDITGDDSSLVFNKNVSLEARSNEDYLQVNSKNILLQASNNYADTNAGLFLAADDGFDAQVSFMEAGSTIWSIGNDGAESTNTLSFSTGAVLGTNEKMSLDNSGNTKQEGSISIKEKSAAIADTDTFGQVWVKNTDPEELCFTDGGGTDIVGIGKYHFDTKITNFTSSATGNFLPLSGGTIETTNMLGKNENIAMVAPYNGTLERAVFRSEIAQDGNLIFAIHESADGTEAPALGSVGSKTTAIDIADDTAVIVDFDSMTSGANTITKGRIYAIKMTTPSAPTDTNVTLVFKWDITS
tara:strand:- start:1633 stop:2673 length:1041 start_codon:yes stop_codon:yes gene_type:complete